MDAEAKKTVLRMIPYGLYVLTSESKDGRVAASTVNWVTQASFEPPLVAVGVKVGSAAHEIAKESGSFALNVLGKGQKDLAFSFFKPLDRDGDIIGGEAFEIGDAGTLYGKPYEVCGRMLYQDPEGYQSVEYLLFNPDEGYLWLAEEMGHYVVNRPTQQAPARDPMLLPPKAGRPVKASCSTVPRENRSLRASSSCPSACSGDMLAGVPKTCPGAVSCDAGCFAMPKSMSFGSPEGKSMTLAGLTSRWMMPSEWAAWRASASRATMCAAWRHPRPWGEITFARLRPLRNSSAMKSVPVSSSRPTSCTTTMLG